MTPRPRRLGLQGIRTFAACVAGLGLVVPVTPGIGLAAGERVPQRQLRERSVVVSVTSGDTPVTNLAATDFVVREDGLSREVVRVAPAPPPSHVALLVDDSVASQSSLQYLRSSLKLFVKAMAAASPAPQMSLMTFGERPTRRTDFTPNAEIIDRAVDRIFPITGSGAYFLEAILETTKHIALRTAERPVIVAFVAEDGPEFSNILQRDIAAALQKSGASLWTVVLQGGTQSLASSAARERAMVLSEGTRDSGGLNKVVLTPQALDSSLTTLAQSILARHLVTYGRPESLIPPERVEVEVKRPGVRVHAARWIGR